MPAGGLWGCSCKKGNLGLCSVFLPYCIWQYSDHIYDHPVSGFKKRLCLWSLWLGETSSRKILSRQLLLLKGATHDYVWHDDDDDDDALPSESANHGTTVKLITLGTVSWRQPGDIYLWTHVSNLAITVPLINSLPESLPEDQRYRDSDRLMLLLPCNSVALKFYND